MFTFLIEFFSLVLFLGCVWHALRSQGRPFAQQWFIGAYLYVFIREVINQVVLQTYTFAPDILRIGVVPGDCRIVVGRNFLFGVPIRAPICFDRKIRACRRVDVCHYRQFCLAHRGDGGTTPMVDLCRHSSHLVWRYAAHRTP